MTTFLISTSRLSFTEKRLRVCVKDACAYATSSLWQACARPLFEEPSPNHAKARGLIFPKRFLEREPSSNLQTGLVDKDSGTLVTAAETTTRVPNPNMRLLFAWQACKERYLRKKQRNRHIGANRVLVIVVGSSSR